MEYTYRVSTRHNAQGHEKGAALILTIGFIKAYERSFRQMGAIIRPLEKRF